LEIADLKQAQNIDRIGAESRRAGVQPAILDKEIVIRGTGLEKARQYGAQRRAHLAMLLFQRGDEDAGQIADILGDEKIVLREALDPTAAEDVLATLTRLTARTVAGAARRHGVTEVIASGGGVRNPTLMAALAEELAPAPLRTSEALGLPAQAKEAYAFALLGFLTHQGVEGTLARATGARHASVLGSITPGSGSRSAPRVLRLQ